jgi:hypothetical protein
VKQFVDHEFVGFGKLTFDDPVCSWLAEHDLLVRGYRRFQPCHVCFDGQRWELADWKRVIEHNVTDFLHSIKDLPLKLYAHYTFDGGVALVPFQIVEGTQVKTHLRSSTNQIVFVNIIAEPLIRLF